MAVDWVIDGKKTKIYLIFIIFHIYIYIFIENLNPYMLEINNCPYLTPEQPVEVL